MFVGDVTSNADCEAMAKAAVETYGKLNVLVNNVGISGPGLVTEVDEDLWDTVIDVNLKSVMLTSKHAIPPMVEQGGGSIINLSSIVGLRAGSGSASHPYAASKGGIIALSNSMAVHYGRDSVRLNCIAPGHIHSPMVARHSSQEMLDLRRRGGAPGNRRDTLGRGMGGGVPGIGGIPLDLRRDPAGGRRTAGRHPSSDVSPLAGTGTTQELKSRCRCQERIAKPTPSSAAAGPFHSKIWGPSAAG